MEVANPAKVEDQVKNAVAHQVKVTRNALVVGEVIKVVAPAVEAAKHAAVALRDLRATCIIFQNFI